MHTATNQSKILILENTTTSNKWSQIIDVSCHINITWNLSRHAYAYRDNTVKHASSHEFEYVKQVNAEHRRVMSHTATWNESWHSMNTATTQSNRHYLTDTTTSDKCKQSMDESCPIKQHGNSHATQSNVQPVFLNMRRPKYSHTLELTDMTRSNKWIQIMDESCPT